MTEEKILSRLKIQAIALIAILIGLVLAHRTYTHSNDNGKTIVLAMEGIQKEILLSDSLLLLLATKSTNDTSLKLNISSCLDTLQTYHKRIQGIIKLLNIENKHNKDATISSYHSVELLTVQERYKEYQGNYTEKNRIALIHSLQQLKLSSINLQAIFRHQLNTYLEKIEIHHKYDLPIFVVLMGITGMILILRFNKTIRQRIEQNRDILERLHLLSIVAKKTKNTVFITDTDMRIRWVNNAFEQQTGYTLQEVQGHRPSEFLLHDNADKNTVESLRSALALQQSFNGEILNINKAGQEYWTQIQTDPIYDDNNQYTGFVVVEFDITEHRRTQEEIKATAQLLENLMENIIAGIYVEDETNTIIYINQKIFTLFGDFSDKNHTLHNSSQLLINSIQHYFPSPKQFLENIIAITSSRLIINDEMHQLVDGRYIERTYIPLEQQSGKTWNVWMYRDVTRRMQSDELLRKNEETLRKAQEIAKMASFESPASGTKDYWSKNPGIAFGFDQSVDIQSINLQKLVSEDVYAMILDEWQKSIKEKKSFDIDFPIVHQDNSIHYVRCIGEPHFDEQGNYIEMLGIVQNITEKKLAEIAVMEAKEESDRANRAKSAFLSSMTHELRTPLNAIIGFSQILENDISITDKQREFVTAMYKSGQHLLSMINDVLDMSKIEADKLELCIEPCNIASEIDDVATMFTLHCHRKNIEFKISKDCNLPAHIMCDKKRLRQIWINLLGNGVKFTDKGYVEFTAIADEFYQNDGNNYVMARFCIKDTGIGIHETRLPTLYEPFMQSNVSNSEGTGLGLAITAKIIKEMNGTISVSSTVGVGTEFIIKLPFQIVIDEAMHNTKHTEFVVRGIESSSVKPVALLIDDVESNLLVHQALLRRVGFDCVLANNADTALYLAEHKHPTVIILDIMMPLKNGVEIMRDIRSQSWGKTIPIIALTANGKAYKREEMLGLGFDEFIIKPFLIEQLFDAIEHTAGIKFIREKKIVKDISPLNDANELLNIKRFIQSLDPAIQSDLEENIEFQFFDTIEQILTDIAITPSDTHFEAYSNLLRYAKNYNVAAMLKVTDILKKKD
ncbi:MAG: PAS domain S-box protein [Ignavibacteria bacterium]|nr:PAS domain S-box protein [Ignavibacteria bacterium]